MSGGLVAGVDVDPLPGAIRRAVMIRSRPATVILGEAKDLELRILRSFAVSATQDDERIFSARSRSSGRVILKFIGSPVTSRT